MWPKLQHPRACRNKESPRLGGRGIFRRRRLEGVFGFRRHHAIGSSNQRFPVKRMSCRRLAKQAQGRARGIHGVAGAATHLRGCIFHA